MIRKIRYRIRESKHLVMMIHGHYQKSGNSLLKAFNQDPFNGDGTISSRRYLKAKRDVAKISGFIGHIADFCRSRGVNPEILATADLYSTLFERLSETAPSLN